MAEQKDSLFTFLIRERPGNFSDGIVYEDDHVIAFFDKFPLVKGHTLVVPKQQFQYVHQLPKELAAQVGAAVATVAAKVIKGTGATDYNIINNNGAGAGQEIPHVHFHIIPRFEGDYSRPWFAVIEELRNADANPRPAGIPDTAYEGDLKELRDRVRDA